MPLTEQDITWSGDFGREYTDRSPGTPEDMDALYAKIKENQIEFPLHLSRAAVDFVRRCLEIEVEARATAARLVSPW